ncbi:MAG: ATP-binding protein, partial [Chloroflexota bacterium]|nr:ATP-binding protein [Chloroflexota bacterium]
LLDNAIQYTEGGEITVVAGAQPNGLIEISITDTGVGIAAAHLPHLFERFYRVDQARTRAGAGLGLAIALRIAQAHSGTIQVASELGKGTIFTVQLAQI